MEKLFCCIITLLCISMLTLPAMADALPLPYVGEAAIYLILMSIAVIATVILVLILINRKK